MIFTKIFLHQEDSSHCPMSPASDSGYSSIAESAQPTVRRQTASQAELENIEEKISEIFDSMNIGE